LVIEPTNDPCSSLSGQLPSIWTLDARICS
jgi:hypothetical protein